MGRLEDTKKRYDKTGIPRELSKQVQAVAEESGARKRGQKRVVGIRRRKVLTGEYAGAVAELAIVFITALNTNIVLADMVAWLPAVGDITRFLTSRPHEKDEGDWRISARIPSMEMIAADTSGLGDSLNQEIYELCIRYGEEVQQQAMEYKKAFMETGGTGEEWTTHDIEINVWCRIKSQTEDYLSFTVMETGSRASAYSEARYYPIDPKNGRPATLQTFLGDEYTRKVGESIRITMRGRQETEGIEFWAQDEGGLSGINENTEFYVNEKESPVIMSDKYEIAPRTHGAMEFEVEGRE